MQVQIPILQTVQSWAESITEKITSTPIITTVTEPTTTPMGPLARLTLLLAALCPSVVLSDAPSRIPEIFSTKFSGTGCPQTSTTPHVSGGLDNLLIEYPDNNFQVRNDGLLSPNGNCQIFLEARGGTPGWQFSLNSVSLRGYRWQSPGVNVNVYATTYFGQDASNTVTATGAITNNGGGVIEGETSYTTNFGGNRAWSPCFDSSGYTGIFVVNLRTTLQGNGGSVFSTWSSTWSLDWRQC